MHNNGVMDGIQNLPFFIDLMSSRIFLILDALEKERSGGGNAVMLEALMILADFDYDGMDLFVGNKQSPERENL